MAELIPALKNPLFVAAAVCAFFLYSGIVKRPSAHAFTTLLPKDGIIEIQGELYGNPVKLRNSSLYKLSVNAESASDCSGRTSSSTGRITVFVPQKTVEVFYPGKLYTESDFQYLPISYSTEAGNRVKVSGTFKNKVFYAHEIEPLYMPSSFRNTFVTLRSKGRLGFKRLMFAWGKAGGLLQALLCGSGEYMEDELYCNFRQTGLSYILALSGMHLSFFAGIIVLLVSRLKNKAAVYIAQTLAVLLFIWFAGNSPSLFRAMLCRFIPMFSAFFCTAVIHPLAVLSLSFLIHTAVFPDHIYEAAFVLSYCSIAGIYIISPILFPCISCYLPQKIAVSISDSISAFIFTLPYSLVCFGTVNPAGIIASLIISPLTMLFMYAGISAILLSSAFPCLSVISDYLLYILYELIKKAAGIFAIFPSFGKNALLPRMYYE
jgi:ComEC/Rec2-related protein